jgi:hypothetical protein
MRKREILCGGAVFVALALAGCGSATGQAAGGGATAPATTATSSAPGSSTAPSTAPGSGGISSGGGGVSSGGGSVSGGGSPGTSSGGTNSGGTHGGVMQPVPGDGPAVPASQVNAAGLTLGGPGQVWTEQGGRYVGLTVEQKGCEQMSAQATSQTSTSVTIQVITTTNAGGGKVCPMYVREVPIGALLAAPLGQRTVQLQAVTRHG